MIGPWDFVPGSRCRISGNWKSTNSERLPSRISLTARPTRTGCRATISSRARCTTHGVTCFSCHDVHGTANDADLLKPANVLCLECHGPKSPNGPHTATIEQHTHHKAESAGSECISCHMPKIEQTVANVNVRGHTFKFIPPSATEELKVPNSCNACHTDKDTQWSRTALRSWGQF